MAVSLATVRRLALALPDAAEAPHHDMTSFRVAGKRELLTESWRRKAPKEVLVAFDG